MIIPRFVWFASLDLAIANSVSPGAMNSDNKTSRCRTGVGLRYGAIRGRLGAADESE